MTFVGTGVLDGPKIFNVCFIIKKLVGHFVPTSFIFLKNAELSDFCDNGLHALKKLMLLNDKNVWILNSYLPHKYKLIKVKFKKKNR